MFLWETKNYFKSFSFLKRNSSISWNRYRSNFFPRNKSYWFCAGEPHRDSPRVKLAALAIRRPLEADGLNSPSPPPTSFSHHYIDPSVLRNGMVQYSHVHGKIRWIISSRKSYLHWTGWSSKCYREVPSPNWEIVAFVYDWHSFIIISSWHIGLVSYGWVVNCYDLFDHIANCSIAVMKWMP